MVDGVITDDNDVFLFGAKTVYRNFFEEKKYVEEYRADQLAADLALTRDKLVRLALFLGSDYTEGVQGVGIVNAMEVSRSHVLCVREGWGPGRDNRAFPCTDSYLTKSTLSFTHTHMHTGFIRLW